MDEPSAIEPGRLSDRQARELAYHRAYASEHAHEHSDVKFDCLDPQQRRWWNAHWEVFHYLRSLNLRGKQCLVVGCGFGEDALLLSKLGADVYAFDLSVELLEIGAALSAKFDLPIHFDQMAAESLAYPDSSFDLVLVIDILHHCDITRSLAEIRRVAKSGAVVVIDEIYTHSALQRIRESRIVNGHVYPAVARLLYGKSRYITEDERKLNERDLEMLLATVRLRKLEFFGVAVKRVIPEWAPWMSKLDRLFLCASGYLGRVLAGRFVLIADI